MRLYDVPNGMRTRNRFFLRALDDEFIELARDARRKNRRDVHFVSHVFGLQNFALAMQPRDFF